MMQNGYNNPGEMPPSYFNNPMQRPGDTRRNNTLPIVLAVVSGVVILAIIGAICFFHYLDKTKISDNALEAAATQAVDTRNIQATAPSAPNAKIGNEVASMGWHEGTNELNGSFYYKGATYGFTITVNYSNGALSNARYRAHGQSGVAKISTARLLNNGTTLEFNGGTDTYTSINVSYSNGSYKGSMVRGDHNGTCTITL